MCRQRPPTRDRIRRTGRRGDNGILRITSELRCAQPELHSGPVSPQADHRGVPDQRPRPISDAAWLAGTVRLNRTLIRNTGDQVQLWTVNRSTVQG